MKQKLLATIIALAITWVSIVWLKHTWAMNQEAMPDHTNLEANVDTTQDCIETRKQLALPDWWELNDECRSQKYVPILPDPTATRETRILAIFQWMWYTLEQSKELWDVYRSAGRIGRIRWEFMVCVAYADSSLGKALLTQNNPGNVGNTDSWGKRSFATIEQGIYAIAQTLNNKYLWHKTTLMELSLYDMRNAWMTIDYYYASWHNWSRNIRNCLGMVYQKKVPMDFNYRF